MWILTTEADSIRILIRCQWYDTVKPPAHMMRYNSPLFAMRFINDLTLYNAIQFDAIQYGTDRIVLFLINTKSNMFITFVFNLILYLYNTFI